MCVPFSCIIHKSRGVLVAKALNEHSHSVIAAECGLTDKNIAFKRDWLKVELTPSYGEDLSTSPDNWQYRVDEQGTLPQWYTNQTNKWDKWVRIAAEAWQRKGLALVASSQKKDPKPTKQIRLLKSTLREKAKVYKKTSTKESIINQKAWNTEMKVIRSQRAKANVLFRRALLLQRKSNALSSQGYQIRNSRTLSNQAYQEVLRAYKGTLKAAWKARNEYYKARNSLAQAKRLAAPMTLLQALTRQ